MDFESFEEIIDFALEKEREAVSFYADLATQAPFSGGREVLESFAKEEEKHVDLLEKFGQDKKALEGYDFKWIPDIKRSNYIVETEYTKDMGYPELLRLAMKREEMALKMYNDLQEKADKEDLKKVFKMLSQEEANHKLKLETIYDDYMAEQGD